MNAVINGELSEEMKEELFSEFALRLATMEKEDKKLTSAQNTHVMCKLTKVNEELFGYRDPKNRVGTAGIDDQYLYFGSYDAYLEVRKLVPIVIGIKRRADILRKDSRARADKKFGYRRKYVLQEGDQEEATKLGRILLETIKRYLEEEGNADEER